MPYSISPSCNQPLPIFDVDNVYNTGISYNCLGSLSASPVRCDTQSSISMYLPCQSTQKGICFPKSAGEFSNKIVSSSNPKGIIKRSESENRDEGGVGCSQTKSSYVSIRTLEKMVFPEVSFPEGRSDFDACRGKLKGSVSQGDSLYFKYPSAGENWFSLTSKTSIGREGKNGKKEPMLV
ncbi:hypothetical protein LSM04_001148 [Trypanosoma melophagium]|uniref:uncharacterized protein n=1 Tax=Trypanosoma melophagium TaxID=715481 RepID=UPI00351A6B2A|nr:hypothetical protein LSM04_001148 [Trypanosoma melophagium]